MKSARLLFILLVLSSVHFAAINKKEDPITDTQTNPIRYDDKMNEVKEGDKQAPKPTYKLYPKEDVEADTKAPAALEESAQNEENLAEDSDLANDEYLDKEPASESKADAYSDEDYQDEDQAYQGGDEDLAEDIKGDKNLDEDNSLTEDKEADDFEDFAHQDQGEEQSSTEKY